MRNACCKMGPRPKCSGSTTRARICWRMARRRASGPRPFTCCERIAAWDQPVGRRAVVQRRGSPMTRAGMLLGCALVLACALTLIVGGVLIALRDRKSVV